MSSGPHQVLIHRCLLGPHTSSPLVLHFFHLFSISNACQEFIKSLLGYVKMYVFFLLYHFLFVVFLCIIFFSSFYFVSFSLVPFSFISFPFYRFKWSDLITLLRILHSLVSTLRFWFHLFLGLKSEMNKLNKFVSFITFKTCAQISFMWRDLVSKYSCISLSEPLCDPFYDLIPICDPCDPL